MEHNSVSRGGFQWNDRKIIGTVFYKLKNAPCDGLQLDASTDMESRAQWLVHVRISDTDSLTFVKRYWCCLNLVVNTTVEQVFAKLNEFMTEKQIPCDKCFSRTNIWAIVWTILKSWKKH